jgi:hypothetical protein
MCNIGRMTIDNAQVIEPDLFASNGVIHVINSVILRPSDLPVKAASNELVKAVANSPNKVIPSKPTEKAIVNQQLTPVSFNKNNQTMQIIHYEEPYIFRQSAIFL